MAVDPKIQEILDLIASIGAPPHYQLEPPQAREAMTKAVTLLAGDMVKLPRVENISIPGPAGEIPARLYAPKDQAGLPILVYYHGGGWVMGNLDTHDTACRRLARASGALVVSVDYRLAPEHKFPAAAQDAIAALEWVAANGKSLGGDPARLAVGGDSAGGNLAAVAAQAAQESGGPELAAQLLIYPVTNHGFDLPSFAQYAEGFPLTLAGMRWFWDHYLTGPEDADNPLASPFRAESLAGLPPALVVIAEYDVLRDDGLAYAGRLRDAGVSTEVAHYDDMIHVFFTMNVVPRANEIIGEIGTWLAGALI